MLAELELHKIKVLSNNKVLDIERIDSISYSLLDIINDIANDPISRYEALNLLLSIIKDRANNYINSNVYNYSDEHANARLAWDRADKVGEEMYEQKINRHNSIPKVTKKSIYLKDIYVARWYKHIARTSKINADTSLRRLYNFCEKHKIKPLDLIELADKNMKELKHLIIDYINWMEEKGYSKEYQRGILKTIKHWLRFNDISIDIPFKHRYTKLANIQRLPNDDEYTEIINKADLRTKVIIALISKSGLRPQVIGNYNATDGLRLKDMPDIKIINGKAICRKYPCMIKVRAELSKNNKPYVTFLSKQGVRYLLTYLNDRLKKGEVLTDDSPIITRDYRYEYIRRDKPFITTITVCKYVRVVVNEYNIRPYDLRHWFATQLEIAVAKGKISSSVKEELMGHISGIEHHYTYAKYNLVEDLVRELRESYSRTEEFLDVEVSNKDNDEEMLREEAKTILERFNKEELLNFLANAGKGNSLNR